MIVKQGGHRLFERDQETARVVSEMLLALETRGMDGVREYSGSFDGWTPPSFELSAEQIRGAIASLDRQAIEDTAYCQGNVRAFAQAQLETLKPLEVEIRPGVIPATVNAMAAAGADRIFILGGVPALALMAFGRGDVRPVDMLCGAGNKYVAEAKRQLFGRCGIDLLACPTEILVIAVLPTWDVASQSWRDNGIVAVAYGDKTIGTNHILPTSRVERYGGGRP
jgi:sulfopropanediol 3-dehydrogenase